MRTITASGIVPSTMAGRIMCITASIKSPGSPQIRVSISMKPVSGWLSSRKTVSLMRPDTGVRLLHRHQHDQHHSPPENRHRIAGQRDAHRGVIEDRAAFDRRQHPNRDAYQHREQHRAEAQLQRGLKARNELAPDGDAAFE